MEFNGALIVNISIGNNTFSIKKFEGSVTNNIEYAEPVCFGVNLPPSWGGQYRTRQGTVAGFPELIGKELEQYVMQQIRRAI